MNERMNMGQNSAGKKKLQELEDAEREKAHFAMHPEQLMVPQNLREAGPEIREFENLVALFEAIHSFEKLHSIVNLTPVEAAIHPIREPARVALIPIVALLNTLKKETNISTERHEYLKAKYKRLSRAVGMINKNKVDHNR